MAIRGSYLAIAGGGMILLWSGIKGSRWSDVIRNVIAGKDPHTTTQAYLIRAAPPDTSGSASGGGSVGGAPGSLAATFSGYAGRVPYLWSGANPRGWDCSGAFNYVANHDCGITIPGSRPHTFTGRTHGPNTAVYMLWLPTHASRVPRNQVAANDVCLWQTHMGVAVDNTEYVSAYDTAEGTVIKPIHGGGPNGEIATFWRLR
jgi:cell wall-associated NlpC family hydrolase